MAQASLITWGFGFSQYPRLVAPGMTLYNAAAPVEVLRPVLVALGLGSLVLIPSLLWLFSIFKSHRELNPFD
jgi:cytochrome d ubiquinol oxidase subunit II